MKKLKKEISGINITLPYKQVIIQYLDKIINDAKETHSVNTVYLDNNGALVGENTDVYGIQAAYLNRINLQKINSALILGAGGSTIDNICTNKVEFKKNYYYKSHL